MTPELLEEALYVLADENEKMMDRACDRQGFFKGGKTAGKGRIELPANKFARPAIWCNVLGVKNKTTILWLIPEYIFLLCQEMKLQPEARFLAIELFEK